MVCSSQYSSAYKLSKNNYKRIIQVVPLFSIFLNKLFEEKKKVSKFKLILVSTRKNRIIKTKNDFERKLLRSSALISPFKARRKKITANLNGYI